MKKNKFIITLYISLTIATASLFAQKNAYVVNENTSWSNFYLLDVSMDSNWLYFDHNIHFVENVASIKNLNTGKVIDFKNGHSGKFSNNSKWFSIITNNNTLNWVDLKIHRQDSLQKINTAAFTANSNFLIAHSFENYIHFIDLSTSQLSSPGQSTRYNINPVHESVAIALKTEKGEVLKIFDLKNNSVNEVPKLTQVQIKRMAWNKSGDKLAFVFQQEQSQSLNIGVFDYNSNTIRFLNDLVPSSNNNSFDIENADITMNDVGSRLFFYVKNNTINQNSNPNIEIWDTADPVVLSRKKYSYADRDAPLLNVWLLDSDKVIPIETNEFSKSFWNPNGNYAISFNPHKYEPQFHFREFADLYAINLENGSKKKIIDKQYTHGYYLKFSPNSNYLAYFRENNWWLYDIRKNTHTNLTKEITFSLFDASLTSYSFPQPYGMSAWSSDEKEVYINDTYDIWKVSVDGKQKQKMTDGRKNKIRYSIADLSSNQKIVSNDHFMRIPVLQSENPFVISAQSLDNYSTGFYTLKPNGSLHKIAFKDKRVSRLIALNHNTYVFQEESLNIPPFVTKVNTKTKLEVAVVQSNKAWQNYKWPEKKLIQYSTHFADDLKGILIYPVNYNPEMKYPMVVHVYEDSSKYFHIFNPPTHSSDIGFTGLNFALYDYFVLLPDIVYLKNKVGYSATHCVLSAIDKVLEIEKSVDEDKLGLIGHSFGGYETAFIITQTDRFKAAVAGNGVFNLYSNYFEYQKVLGVPEYLRIERGQFRFKNSFFENKEAYLENTPIHHFDKVNTPLLIWAGKEDDNINPDHSVQGYLALRRLQKPALMLLYENEGHVIIDNNNQKDLTNRIKNWFNSYLK